MSWHSKVIVALDYENPDEACRLIDTLDKKIECYKLGPQLFTRSGPEMIQYLHNKKKQIFVDLKLHDTPSVVSHTVRQLAEMGVHYTTVHCLGGKQLLEAAASGCRGSRLKLLGVTLLTSFNHEEAKQWGWSEPAGELVYKLAEQAVQARLSGVLCSVQEAEQLRERLPQGFLLITPGIRLLNKEVFQDDQVRVASPKEAFKVGADFLIVGRPITQARDPKLVVEQLFA